VIAFSEQSVLSSKVPDIGARHAQAIGKTPIPAVAGQHAAAADACAVNSGKPTK